MTPTPTPTPRLILITDPCVSDAALLAAIRAVCASLPSRALAVQLRDKTDDATRRSHLARHLRGITRAHAQLFVVNSDLELAREVEADGAHLPVKGPSVEEARAALGRNAWISVPAHTDDDVRGAVEDGADAVLVSPIFAAPGKGQPRGVDAIRAARAFAPSLRIYALGGVDASNAASCQKAGATGAAAIRAILASADPAVAARSMWDSFPSVGAE